MLCVKGLVVAWSIEKNGAPAHGQGSVWNMLKQIMATLNRASHHSQPYGKKGPLLED